MKFTTALLLLASSSSSPVLATPASSNITPNTVGALHKRANFPIPASKGSVTLSEPQTIKASEPFDGGLKTYGRGVSCSGQAEGGDADAVFLLEDGATLKNAIIGTDQIEGVHCKGKCTIENVWWEKVCEDALSIKGDGDASVIGGGATGAEDKIIQHNGLGTVTIDGFTAVDFGKLYRSCGNCKVMGERNVVVKNVKATDGKVLVGINSNKGDVATITDSCATSVKEICVEFEGTTPGNEPKEIGSGPSDNCKYTELATC
ncbi:polysaccharide lyase family 3 protein [Hypoxylon fragiforme]|uniref:polysaccharide lyase family 3 protein n=1 Tax=Hypoxylon fragiforme TaxID=63214 RepID=UPI0020C681A7|nr:polysaccharide lyase family 3 protein [Hypoxylon fragiforme]KAI2603544.1 polysaccharide lyase family 3 protein [Hypoxylon fragiforme]